MELYQLVGTPMRRLRLRAGISQRAAGQLAALSENTIYRIEAGEDAYISTVLKLAASYGYVTQLAFTRSDER